MRTPEAVAGMLCPVCKVGLHMSDRQGIEIDYCPQCRGIWLDRGELDKIIERSGGGDAPEPTRAPQPPAPPQQPQGSPWQQPGGGYPQQQGYGGGYGHQGHDPRYYKHKRKKSFLEELFD